jgi:RNA polymerase sigma factor (sigma-70 family)
MPDEWFERFFRQGDRRSGERFIEERRSLVESVCRRFLRDPDDVADVSQEVFLRFLQHASGITTSPAAWLASTASTASVDYIRRASRERRRRRELAKLPPPQPRLGLAHDAIHRHLESALLMLAARPRELLIARFFRAEPLRTIAAREKASVATISRRVSAALRELAAVLRESGAGEMSDGELARQLQSSVAANEMVLDDDLRFAPDWREASRLWAPDCGRLFEGWSRPIRVGMLFSYSTVLTFSRWAHRYGIIAEQVRTAMLLPAAGVQLVGIIEPDTAHHGMVERTLREYGLIGGLIEADDAQGLATLDVIVVGNNRRLDPPLARAICESVRSAGVGLLNEYWTSGEFPDTHDAAVRDMMLAASPWYAYHTPGRCGAMRRATVVREHALLPGLKAGTTVDVKGCAPAYHVRADAQILMIQEHTIGPDVHGMPSLGVLPMPSYVLGNLGRGRVAVINIWSHARLLRYLSVGADEYFTNLLRWLAEPRREQN